MAEFGVFLFDGSDIRRPRSKKEIKDTLPANLYLEGTSPHSETIPDGKVVPLTRLPDGQYGFVGPDPYNSRRFYGQITLADNGQIYVS
jgi:hypothetical protein